MKSSLWIFSLSGLLGFAGCAVGPDYAPPRPAAPVEFTETPAAEPVEAVSKRWWEAWEDPSLNAVVAQALAHNQDLGLARTRILEARAGLRTTRSAFWPQLNASGLGQRQRASENSPNGPGAGAVAPGMDFETDFFDVGGALAWELDLFGGTRRASQAAVGRLDASLAKAAATRLAVTSATVDAYWTWRGAQAALIVAERLVVIQENAVADTETLVATGLENDLALRQAEALLASTRILVPTWQGVERESFYALVTLSGQLDGLPTSEDFLRAPSPEAETLPTALFPALLPADVLRQRPDVRGAERSLAAATADLGVAVAAFYPRISLTGGFGFQSDETGDLFNSASQAWSIGPQVSLPLFQGGRLSAQRDAAEARLEAAQLSFEQTVLRALAEAESAYATARTAREIARQSEVAARAATAAADLARVLYGEGLTNNLDRLTAEAEEADTALAAVQAETAAHLAWSRLYRALGGGMGDAAMAEIAAEIELAQMAN